MRMKNFLIVPLLGLLCGCGDVEEYEQPIVTNDKVENFTLNVSYDGKEYNVPCQLIEEKDSIIFLDEGFRNLFFNEISKLPNLVCEVKNDGSVEYKSEAIEDSAGIVPVQRESVQPLGSTGDTYLQFYSDKNFKGSSQKITLTFKYFRWQNADLSPIKWGNTISSIRVRNHDNNITSTVILEAYDQRLFKGHVLRYQFYENYPANYHLMELDLPDLEKVPMSGGGTWNDKIVSMRFYYR